MIKNKNEIIAALLCIIPLVMILLIIALYSVYSIGFENFKENQGIIVYLPISILLIGLPLMLKVTKNFFYIKNINVFKNLSAIIFFISLYLILTITTLTSYDNKQYYLLIFVGGFIMIGLFSLIITKVIEGFFENKN